MGGQERPVAAAAHQTVLARTRRFYAWAVERGHLPANRVGQQPNLPLQVRQTRLERAAIDKSRFEVPKDYTYIPARPK